MRYLKYSILFADLLFVLWILYNAIDDGFGDMTKPSGIVPLALAALLLVNLGWIWKR